MAIQDSLVGGGSLYILDKAYVKVRKIALITNHPEWALRMRVRTLRSSVPDRAKRACPRASISHEQVYPTSSITTAPRCLERSEMAKTRLYILDVAYIKTRKIALTLAYIINPFTPSTTSLDSWYSPFFRLCVFLPVKPFDSTSLLHCIGMELLTMIFTTMAIVEARTYSTYVDLMGSVSLTQGSVSEEAH